MTVHKYLYFTDLLQQATSKQVISDINPSAMSPDIAPIIATITVLVKMVDDCGSEHKIPVGMI